MKFDRTDETTALEPVNAIVAVVIKPEAQLTAENFVQQPETATKKGNMSVISH